MQNFVGKTKCIVGYMKVADSMDEIYNFRDKYLKEYRVKNTNISILKKAK